jgi:aspartate carbamoyltransferase catalytic subunit
MISQEILAILEAAQHYRDLLDGPGIASRELEGVTVCNAFFENSTRTRLSFELAEKRLSAITVSFASIESSTAKGETLLDTLRVIQAMRVDLMVVRHPSPGAAAYLARHLEGGVINAGDGAHEHPTQGLLDLLTLAQVWGGRFEGRRIAIVGDIAHSRVARSAIHGLRALGTRVVVSGPPTLVPRSIEALGVAVAATVEDAIRNADAVMPLRLQCERMEQGLLPSVPEYVRAWGINLRRLELLDPRGVVLHPGPMNRGIEISPEVADHPRSLILEQVTNGVAVRCAVLERCAAALPRRRTLQERS